MCIRDRDLKTWSPLESVCAPSTSASTNGEQEVWIQRAPASWRYLSNDSSLHYLRNKLGEQALQAIRAKCQSELVRVLISERRSGNVALPAESPSAKVVGKARAQGAAAARVEEAASTRACGASVAFASGGGIGVETGVSVMGTGAVSEIQSGGKRGEAAANAPPGKRVRTMSAAQPPCSESTLTFVA